MTTVCRKIEYGSSEFCEAARFRFHVCCVELGWFDPSNYPDQQETDEYDRFAEHFGVYDGEQLVGYCRLIAGINEFPTEKHSRKMTQLNGTNRCEVSRLVVDREYRRNALELALIRKMYEDAIALHLEYAMALIEPSLLRLLNRLGFPFERAGDAVKNILGADILIPCVVKISDIHMMAEVAHE